MPTPKTLMDFTGAPQHPSPLDAAALVVVDLQREYVDGALPLENIEAAVAQSAQALEIARSRGVPVFFFRHRTAPGAPIFDPDGPHFQIVPGVAPRPGETVLDKSLPNCFAGTGFEERIRATGRTELIIVGAMTHMCISATARSALDRGIRATVVAAACATRALPGVGGGTVPARAVHETALAELADLSAIVVPDAGAWS